MTAYDDHLVLFEPDHDGRAAELLLWQHRGKPRIEAAVAALATGAQLAEHTSWAVIVGASTVQGAEGVNLDRWGAIVGEQRGGIDDEQLRLFIELRIRVNTLHPSEDAMWSLIADAVAPYEVRAYDLLDGAKFYVDSIEPVPDPVRTRLASLVADFRPAGRICTVLETLPERMLFEWEDGGPSLITDDETDPITVIPDIIYSGRGRS
jgi:hypothetical protein